MPHPSAAPEAIVPLRDPADPAVVELDAPDRRRFLQLLGASLALAGQGGCNLSQPTETIVPYVRSPEHLVPGQPLSYATAVTLGGYATGVLVESHLGRPTKIEGNTQHPASLGGTDAMTQAAILSLYDPERSQVISHDRQVQTWVAFRDTMSRMQKQLRNDGGAGMRVLTETITSPTLTSQLEHLLREFPQARWHSYEPLTRDNVYAGSRLAFGEALEPRYEFTKADVIVSLDANFLADGPGHVRYARDFASRRQPTPGEENNGSGMHELFQAESGHTITGSMANHRLAIPPSRIATAAQHLAREILAVADGSELSTQQNDWVSAAASALAANPGRGLILAGDQQPAQVHALACAMNAQLGNIGETVEYIRPVGSHAGEQTDSLRELVDDMRDGRVELLVILGGNPVYNAPADLEFAEALATVQQSVHLSIYENDTSQRCDWHIPAAHELESWSDARAFDGTASILQPLISPLYDGKTPHEVVSVLLGNDETSHETVRSFWEQQQAGNGFEMFWRTALHEGVVADSRYEARDVQVADVQALLEETASTLRSRNSRADNTIEVVLQPDPTIHDGRFAKNAWLQELPKPITTLTWDNAALLSPATAKRLGVNDTQLMELARGQRTIRIPALTVPGHADDCATLHFGYGQAAGGTQATEHGANVFPLFDSPTGRIVADVSVHPLAKRYPLARTQQHHRMEGRELVRTLSLAEYDGHAPAHVQENEHDCGHGSGHADELTIFESPPPATDDEYAWGMSINLNTCIGCSACVVACQAENNVPVVGKQEVLRGREMHWIRVDQYLEETPRGPQALHQPVACMHCENAPCEVVCPVAATVHSEEGLNEMVYNRCVGTRYCSNNCPYKVRRFNFLQYTDDETPVMKLLRNPDVTVRMRGVMEKCTYCVQRINAARIAAKKENRRIADGEVVTACQQACPMQAIVFGDTSDPTTQVSQAKALPGDYGLLTELNTQPRTTYLPRVVTRDKEADK